MSDQQENGREESAEQRNSEPADLLAPIPHIITSRRMSEQLLGTPDAWTRGHYAHPPGAASHGGPLRDKYGLDVEIKTEKELYFDKEVVRGEVTVNAERNVTLQNAMILLLCRFVCKDPQTGRVFDNRYITLHVGKVIVAAICELTKGENIFTFDFTIPEFTPSSFRCVTGECIWNVRFVFNGDNGLTSVGKQKIIKCSTLYPLPGFVPTVQAERDLLHGAKIRAEARLSRDVYGPGEGIDCTIIIHQDTSDPLDVRKVKAKIVQHIVATKNRKVLCNEKHEVDSARIPMNTWHVTTTNKATVAERTFSMRPSMGDIKNVAGYYKNGTERQPAPSCSTRENKHFLQVKYEFVVSIKFFSAETLDLVLPFAMQSDESLLEKHGLIEEDVKVFPRLDLPPAYGELEHQSAPSYTSLRRESVDWVLADQLDRMRMGEADEDEGELQIRSAEPSPRRRRASSVAQGVLSLAGISEDAAHAARLHASNAMAYRAAKAARRMSHLGTTLGRRRASSINAEAAANASTSGGGGGGGGAAGGPSGSGGASVQAGANGAEEDNDAVPPPGTNTSVYAKSAAG